MAEPIKFTIISPESVKLYGEAEGLSNIPNEIAKSLAEDVTYRLRETIQVRNNSDINLLEKPEWAPLQVKHFFSSSD